MSAPAPASAVPVEGDAGAANHAASEGAEASDGVGSTSTLREMLMSTGPDPDLAAVESPWDPENGGQSRVYRGIQKALGADGMPAIVDIVVGGMEWITSLEQGMLGGDGDEDETDQEDVGDGNGDPLAGSDAAAG